MPGSSSEGAEVIGCDGLIVAPGLVDLHTHLREPGFEHKETVETGTRAAAVGGYTAISSMANTEPVTDHAGVVAEIREKAMAAGLADVFPVGAITKGAGGRVARRDRGHGRGRGAGVQRRRQLRAHRAHAAQRPHLREGVPARGRHRRPLRGRLVGDGRAHARRAQLVLARVGGPARRGRGDDRRPGHRDGPHDRRAAASVSSVQRTVGRPGARRQGRGRAGHRGGHPAPPGLHRRRPVDLRHELQGEPAAALGRGSGALRAGVADGTIDAIATDHAPHAVEEKESEFDLSPPGTIGLETAWQPSGPTSWNPVRSARYAPSRR